MHVNLHSLTIFLGGILKNAAKKHLVQMPQKYLVSKFLPHNFDLCCSRTFSPPHYLFLLVYIFKDACQESL